MWDLLFSYLTAHLWAFPLKTLLAVCSISTGNLKWFSSLAPFSASTDGRNEVEELHHVGAHAQRPPAHGVHHHHPSLRAFCQGVPGAHRYPWLWGASSTGCSYQSAVLTGGGGGLLRVLCCERACARVCGLQVLGSLSLDCGSSVGSHC